MTDYVHAALYTATFGVKKSEVKFKTSQNVLAAKLSVAR